MKKNIVVFFLILLVSTGCTSNTTALPDLTIMGDVQEVVKLNDIWQKLNLQKISYNNNKINAISAEELMQLILPIYDNNNIYLKAVDGFTIKISGDLLKDTYLGFSNEKKWVYISEKHPVNSGIKNISELIVVKSSNDINFDYGLNIVYQEKNIHYSTGELLTMPYSVQNFSDGVSRKESNGTTYEVDVMQQRKVFKLADFISDEISKILVMDRDGEYELSSAEGYIEVSDKGINYIQTTKTYRDIIGIMVNPPNVSVMDTYYDALHYLEQDKDVMVLFIDGFSYKQYKYLKNNKIDTFISQINHVKQANSVFKPVTNAGFAAMITGQPPKANGVPNRDYRELKVPTLFDKARELNKTAILIEGDINILNTKLKPNLNLDANNNGTKDDEIYKNALAEINNNYNLFFVHFHSVDEYGHNYGDLNEKTIKNIQVIDTYIEDLVSKWIGKVIIVSDHGMHRTSNGGTHGEFRSEDLLIPYAIIDGGLGQ